MYEQAEKPKENKSRSVSNSVTQKKGNGKQGFGFVDNRQEAIAQRKLQELSNDRAQENQITQLKSMAHSKGCGCASCNTQMVQRQISEPTANVTQLTCELGHPHHPAGQCVAEKNGNTDEFDKKRASQSHPQHGGDAKGRDDKLKKQGKK